MIDLLDTYILIYRIKNQRAGAWSGHRCLHEDATFGSVSNFVFKAVLIRPGLLRQGEKNRLTAPSPG